MKKPIKQIGKIGKLNQKANREIDKILVEKGIICCEARYMPGCSWNFNLQRAHRHKRHWYRGRPEKLYDFKQVALLCGYCHERIEINAWLTEKLFLRLRGEE